MYFPYGFPQCLDAGEVPPSEGLVDTTFTDQHLLLTYSSRIQAWSAGRHRIRVGEVVVSPTDLEDEGEHVAAAWCQRRRRLALVVSWGWGSVDEGLPDSGVGGIGGGLTSTASCMIRATGQG